MISKTLLASLAPLALAAAPAFAQTPPAPAAQPAPAVAQATAAIQAGTQIKDTSGGAVGTVVRVDGANVILRTDQHEVALPSASFTADPATPNTYLIAMTQAQLNAEVAKTKAAAAQTMTVGATVKDASGGTVGTIEAMEAGFVTVKLATPTASSVRLPATSVAATAAGPVVGATAADLQAQADAATPAAATTETPAAEPEGE